MKMKIGYISQDKRVLQKLPKFVHTLDCEITHPTTIVNPTFIIGQDKYESYYNYVWVDDFNRYYFIDNVELEGQIAILHCTCDVLFSNVDKILGLKCLIDRSETKYRSDYVDPLVTATCKRRTHYKSLSGQHFATNGQGTPVVLTVSGGDS